MLVDKLLTLTTTHYFHPLGGGILSRKSSEEEENGKREGKKGREEERGRGGPEVKEIFPSRLHLHKKRESCVKLFTPLPPSPHPPSNLP